MPGINMEPNEQNIAALAGCIERTLSPDKETRTGAEKFLVEVEAKEGYPLVLLHLVGRDSTAQITREAGAITFKNFIKKNWRIVEDEANRISESDRGMIKNNLVDLMLSSSAKVTRQLSAAVAEISSHDFPAKWTTLLPQLVEKLNNGDLKTINGVLLTTHSIFKRYRYEFKSEALWQEIKYVLDTFAAPFTTTYKAMLEQVPAQTNNPANLQVLFEVLLLLCKIFYSLNFQDLPEHFEDNMEVWMRGMHGLLAFSNAALESDSEEEPGVLDQLRSQIMDNVAIYAQKYDEEFEPYLQDFVTSGWNMLLTTGLELKYDQLVANAMKFLASVAGSARTQHLFAEQGTLQTICEKVVIPNMALRECDEELFEDNAVEYIRRDIEGSDSDTRRRSSYELVRALCKHHEQVCVGIFSAYVNAMLTQNAADASGGSWKHKSTAIFLVSSLATKATIASKGATKTSELVSIPDFYLTHVRDELFAPLADASRSPILRADALKFAMIFRQVLDAGTLAQLVPCFVALLAHPAIVVHSYAAMALDKTLVMRGDSGEGAAGAGAGPKIPLTLLTPHLGALFANAFGAMQVRGSEENEYLMKAVMRGVTVAKADVAAVAGDLVTQLTAVLARVAKNPSQPRFNHYMFETLGAIVRYLCEADPSNVAAFEGALFPPFTTILQEDVGEFLPYVFQIMSQLLELHPAGAIPANYQQLLPFLLVPALWERQGNIPALVRLLQASIAKGGAALVTAQEGTITSLLGVFQKLIASKQNDHEGFYLLTTMVEFLPLDAYSQFLKPIFTLLFQRLMSSRTGKYVKGLLVFLSLFAWKHGPGTLVELVDSMQAGMFGMVVESLYIKDVQKVAGTVERKICAVGITKLLCDCPALFDGGAYANLWSPLLNVLVALFELPEDESIDNDEHYVEIEDTPGYQTAFSQLVYAGKKEHDSVADVADARVLLAQSLAQLSQAKPGKVGGLIQAGLEPAGQQHLQAYLTKAGVALS